jgi:hypothetical protein
MLRAYLLSSGDGIYPTDYDTAIENYYHLKDYLKKLESINIYQLNQSQT